MSENGSDYIQDFRYGYEDANEDKNHNRMSDPITNLASPQPGMIVSDSDDEKLYHRLAAAWDEILQAAESFDVTPSFAGLTLLSDYFRLATVLWIDCFDHGTVIDKYQKEWDITSLNTQGNGTNVIDSNPSHITLTTDNNAIGDNEGTRSEFAIIERARKNRSEIQVELGQTANTRFYWGWNTSGSNAMVAAADEYVIVFFDKSDDDHWQIKVGDGADEEVFTSAIAVDTSDIIHEIWVETDGTVHWAVNGTELDITGSISANKMTASDHYLIVGQAQSVTGAAAIVAEMDYIENEKFKVY